MTDGAQVRVMAPERLTSDSVLRLALTVLNRRAERWATVAMSFSLFVYAIRHPDPWTLGVATVFSVLVMLPFWLKRDA